MEQRADRRRHKWQCTPEYRRLQPGRSCRCWCACCWCACRLSAVALPQPAGCTALAVGTARTCETATAAEAVANGQVRKAARRAALILTPHGQAKCSQSQKPGQSYLRPRCTAGAGPLSDRHGCSCSVSGARRGVGRPGGAHEGESLDGRRGCALWQPSRQLVQVTDKCDGAWTSACMQAWAQRAAPEWRRRCPLPPACVAQETQVELGGTCPTQL